MPDLEAQTLLYLYGIVPEDAPEPGPALEGIERRPVRLLRGSGLAAIVSGVPGQAYSDESLNARLEDLAWVGERGVAHERVLDWFAERGPVIPLSLFSLHRDEERVRERLGSAADRYRGLLERLRGRREWGIKLWRTEAAAEHLDRLSPALSALQTEIEGAPEGRRYLLEKKRDSLRSDELRSASQRLAHGVYGALREVAEHATAVPLPPAQPDAGRVLLLSAAFLVPEDSYPDFQRRVGEAAHEVAEVGFEIEFTGPWPPYHFADLDGA